MSDEWRADLIRRTHDALAVRNLRHGFAESELTIRTAISSDIDLVVESLAASIGPIITSISEHDLVVDCWTDAAHSLLLRVTGTDFRRAALLEITETRRVLPGHYHSDALSQCDEVELDGFSVPLLPATSKDLIRAWKHGGSPRQAISSQELAADAGQDERLVSRLTPVMTKARRYPIPLVFDHRARRLTVMLTHPRHLWARIRRFNSIDVPRSLLDDRFEGLLATLDSRMDTEIVVVPRRRSRRHRVGRFWLNTVQIRLVHETAVYSEQRLPSNRRVEQERICAELCERAAFRAHGFAGSTGRTRESSSRTKRSESTPPRDGG